MRRLSVKWWLALVLLVGVSIAGQVQAQGGWMYLMQGVVHTFHRTTHAITSLFKSTESSRDTIEVGSNQFLDAPQASVRHRVDQVVPEEETSSAIESGQKQWPVRIFLPAPSSGPVIPLPENVPSWPAEESLFQTDEGIPPITLQDLFASPVPSHWDWDEEDWFSDHLPETEATDSFNLEKFQDQILDEIERQSEDVQRQWQSLYDTESEELPSPYSGH